MDSHNQATPEAMDSRNQRMAPDMASRSQRTVQAYETATQSRPVWGARSQEESSPSHHQMQVLVNRNPGQCASIRNQHERELKCPIRLKEGQNERLCHQSLAHQGRVEHLDQVSVDLRHKLDPHHFLLLDQPPCQDLLAQVVRPPGLRVHFDRSQGPQQQ
jgi:hypothetical protein